MALNLDVPAPLLSTWAAVVTIDENARIKLFNPEAERLTGLSAKQVVGRPVASVLRLNTEGDDVPGQRALSGTERRLTPRELTMCVQGRELRVLLGARRHATVQTPHSVVITFVDLSYRQALEQAKRTFMDNVLHELRSPITAISLAAHFLADDQTAVSPERARELLATIQRNANTLQAGLNDLLTDSHASAQPPIDCGSLDLRVVADEACSKLLPMLDQRGQTVDLELDTVPLLRGDARRIEQVLINLIANANKYSCDDDVIIVRGTVEGRMVRVSIEDHGPGINPREAEHIFDRFYRVDATALRAPGLGIGLAIVKGTIETHGGKIGVVPTAPHGATFWFTLPVADGS